MNGIPVERHIGRTVREALPHLADGTKAVCRQVIATAQPVLNLELAGTTAAQPGVIRTWVTHWMPLTQADGRVTGVRHQDGILPYATVQQRPDIGQRADHKEERLLVGQGKLASQPLGILESMIGLDLHEQVSIP